MSNPAPAAASKSLSVKPIRSALISVFHKDGLEPIVRALHQHGTRLYSTGGTEAFIRDLGVPVTAVESLTEYPSILGGRVKTLHPKVFGGILARRSDIGDQEQLTEYEIPEFDLVIVDLYPFEATLASTDDPFGAGEQTLVEKIDIGGISLIRAAAKNFKDVLVCAARNRYAELLEVLKANKGGSTLADRKRMAAHAFAVSSRYDTAIEGWFAEGLKRAEQLETDAEEEGSALEPSFGVQFGASRALRYGENPHQAARFYGDLDAAFEQLHGKPLSYNNLIDVESAVDLIGDFREDAPTFAIIKHTNACGLATRDSISEAYSAALAGDPVSAFGGILIANRPIDAATATKIHELFCEVVIAPSFEEAALETLRGKKNRILLRQKTHAFGETRYRSLLGGLIRQELDAAVEQPGDLRTVTETAPDKALIEDLLFANKAVKHLKSNGIALVKGRQLIGIGTGQTSRIDAMRQAIDKARRFEFELQGTVMASDAFFPFADSVEIAHEAGIAAVIQPGGSIRDQESIDYCNSKGMAMVFTGTRHFKH
jgi:phosphoribosylaminoimidazolecarboxamide formyltransferase/IMP cyclohydrolase